MKKIIVISIMMVSLFVSCKPCESQCKFSEGDEVTIRSKSIINNDGIISEVERNSDCSCYYSVQHSGLLNFTTNKDYQEFELE